MNRDLFTTTAARPESRRAFLQKGALAALAGTVAGTVAAACKPASASVPATAHESHPAPAAPSATSAAAPVAAPAALSARAAADAMDRMHEAGIKAFPAKTAKHGNQPLAPRIEKGVKVFDLVAKKVQWETEPGKFAEAWAYNEMVPGPMIRVREGERVRVNIMN